MCCVVCTSWSEACKLWKVSNYKYFILGHCSTYLTYQSYHVRLYEMHGELYITVCLSPSYQALGIPSTHAPQTSHTIVINTPSQLHISLLFLTHSNFATSVALYPHNLHTITIYTPSQFTYSHTVNKNLLKHNTHTHTHNKIQHSR